jgi:hypothetical protein
MRNPSTITGSNPVTAIKLLSRGSEEVSRKAHTLENQERYLAAQPRIRLDIITPCEGDPRNRSRLQTTQSINYTVATTVP